MSQTQNRAAGAGTGAGEGRKETATAPASAQQAAAADGARSLAPLGSAPRGRPADRWAGGRRRRGSTEARIARQAPRRNGRTYPAPARISPLAPVRRSLYRLLDLWNR